MTRCCLSAAPAASVAGQHGSCALAVAAGAPNVQFNLAMGVNSTRRRNGPMSTEILIDIGRKGHAGGPLCIRHAVVHPIVHFPLTGLGVSMVLERLAGLGGNPPTHSGLYFPFQLLETEEYLARLKEADGFVMQLNDLSPEGAEALGQFVEANLSQMTDARKT